jgi:hypothetical protein
MRWENVQTFQWEDRSDGRKEGEEVVLLLVEAWQVGWSNPSSHGHANDDDLTRENTEATPKKADIQN